MTFIYFYLLSAKDHLIPNPNYQDIFIFLTIPIIVLKPATWAHNLVTLLMNLVGCERN